jgi:hypothetical protein
MVTMFGGEGSSQSSGTCHFSRWTAEVGGLRRPYLQPSAIVFIVAWVPYEVF